MKEFKKRTLPLQKLTMFAETVKQGSITKAADTLCVTQPAVSTALKQLEQYFGVKLLEVVRKKIHLTPGGRALYENWQQVVSSLNELHANMESFHAGIAGELRLVMVSSAKYFIPQAIYTFLQSYPKVQFSCDIKRREYITQAMESDAYDIAILTDPPHSQHLSQYFLQRNPLVFIIHPNHPLAKKTKVRLNELEHVKFIIRESSALISQMLFDLFAKNNLHLDIIFAMDSTEAIKQSVISGLGAALVPRFCVQNEVSHGILTILDVDTVALHNQWGLTCSKSIEKLTIFKNFLQHLKHSSKEML